jgi:GTP-binding protein
MIDMSDESLRDPYEDYKIINKELEEYNPDLLLRPQILVASKMDADGAKVRLENFKSKLEKDIEVVPISAMTNDNLDRLVYKIGKLLEETPFFYKDEEVVDEYVEYNFTPEEPNFIINKVSKNRYEVSGRLVEKLVNRTNFMTEEAISIFLTRLRKLGLDDELRKNGAASGDTIIIAGDEYEFVE